MKAHMEAYLDADREAIAAVRKAPPFDRLSECIASTRRKLQRLKQAEKAVNMLRHFVGAEALQRIRDEIADANQY